MFGAKDIPNIRKLFQEADVDGSGALDLEEFYEVIQKLYGSVSKEEIFALHMKIDTNCDNTVDFGELLAFLLKKNKASQCMEYKNSVFPKPFKSLPVDCNKTIVKMLFRSFDKDMRPSSAGQVRPYNKGQYLSITSTGLLTFWTDGFKDKYTVELTKTEKTPVYSHVKKMNVTDMVYMDELKMLAVSNTGRELLFYTCEELPSFFKIREALIVDQKVTCMNYWSDGTKAVFSFGDEKGSFFVFISYNIMVGGLFCRDCYETVSLREYPTIYVEHLLENYSKKSFSCQKVSIFNDECSLIKYFPPLQAHAICSVSSKSMVLAGLPKPPRNNISTSLFTSRGNMEFFTCVDYSSTLDRLVTGGTNGLLHVWLPNKTLFFEHKLKGHVSPVTHIMFNPKDKVFVSLSKDRNVRVWSEDGWVCIQSFQVEGIGPAPISGVYYNTHNNELLMANSDISKCIGRGTDVFHSTLTSHDHPLCCALYHSIYKQVVSVCQNGVVTVWDILTGKAVMEFKVSPAEHMGHTAMSFDTSQRRLITVCDGDGKVKLWNFNNGTELASVPVTAPKEVTGIVCMEERVFLAGKKSNIIYDLDIDGFDHRFLKHDFLNDISSMDAHGTTLLTASSNGNIVVWDVETAMAIYWLNTRENPRIEFTGRRDLGVAGILPVEKSQEKTKDTGKRKGQALKKTPTHLTRNKKVANISPPIICLKTRQVTGDTATLLTSAEGYICAWSVISKGGLLVKFRAVNDEDAVITSMATDDKEEILVTGDSTGRICLWDIQRFGFKRKADKGPVEHIKGWCVSLCPPPLLSSWQAHHEGVVSIQWNCKCKNIITAGLDCNVCLWTTTGRNIGIFGKDKWDAKQLLEESPSSSSSRSTRPNLEDLANKIEAKWNIRKGAFDGKQDLQLYMDIKKIQEKARKMKAKIRALYNNFKDHQDEYEPKYVHLPPIDKGAGLTHNQTYFKPHPPNAPLIRHGTTGNTLKNPVPPNTLPGKCRSEQTPQRVHLPPIHKGAGLTCNQTHFKPHPPNAPLIRHGTTGNTLKNPVPTNTLPGKCGSEQTPQRVHLPPIHVSQTRSKFVRYKTQQENALKGCVLIPRPPSRLPDKHWSLTKPP
ncbi:WD repeat-containing protein on Y chromosome-like [Chelmon rostratus]|uniref:WD repeat-containing protein on Y chromosome-like n=1 Tax=Chelmon rostratus TaxID=109905 RepID=UPI001BE789EB|nr:WD repeat-containing protein on Y chromosome-like [Chelmon rostratus]